MFVFYYFRVLSLFSMLRHFTSIALSRVSLFSSKFPSELSFCFAPQSSPSTYASFHAFLSSHYSPSSILLLTNSSLYLFILQHSLAKSHPLSLSFLQPRQNVTHSLSSYLRFYSHSSRFPFPSAWAELFQQGIFPLMPHSLTQMISFKYACKTHSRLP